MTWSSAAEFFAMGGYALYVWGAYAACLALMLVEPWLVRRQRAQALHAAVRHSDEGHDA